MVIVSALSAVAVVVSKSDLQRGLADVVVGAGEEGEAVGLALPESGNAQALGRNGVRRWQLEVQLQNLSCQNQSHAQRLCSAYAFVKPGVIPRLAD